MNGEIWKVSQGSVDKFMERKKVWNQIYIEVGLSENISGYAGNYKKLEKVVAHLGRLGIEEKEAERVYVKIVGNSI